MIEDIPYKNLAVMVLVRSYIRIVRSKTKISNLQTYNNFASYYKLML